MKEPQSTCHPLNQACLMASPVQANQDPQNTPAFHPTHGQRERGANRWTTRADTTAGEDPGQKSRMG